jgi:uncharacterized membrane protein HdeD (DUF308 family)
MLATNYSRFLTAFGIATIIMWLSYLVYLPPFIARPNVQSLAEESWKAKEFIHEKYQSQQDMENKINRTLYVAYAKGYTMIILGILAGFLLIVRKQIGRYLAMILALIMMGGRIVAAVMNPRGIAEWFRMIYGYLLVHKPIIIIHRDVIAPLFFIFTILFLLNKSVSRIFTAREQNT